MELFIYIVLYLIGCICSYHLYRFYDNMTLGLLNRPKIETSLYFVLFFVVLASWIDTITLILIIFTECKNKPIKNIFYKDQIREDL